MKVKPLLTNRGGGKDKRTEWAIKSRTKITGMFDILLGLFPTSEIHSKVFAHCIPHLCAESLDCIYLLDVGRDK